MNDSHYFSQKLWIWIVHSSEHFLHDRWVVVKVYVLTLHAIATLHMHVNCNIDLMWTFFWGEVILSNFFHRITANALMVKFNMRGGGQLEKKPFKATPFVLLIQGNFGLWHSKNLLFLVHYLWFLLGSFIYSGDIL